MYTDSWRTVGEHRLSRSLLEDVIIRVCVVRFNYRKISPQL